MRFHLLVVSEKKIKMLKTAFVATKSHHNFLCTNCAHNKYLHEIRAHYLQNFSSYTPHRRRRMQDAGHRTQDVGRMTLSPTTTHYKLTG